ncbi:MAG: hypothetical protein JJU02_14125 [Cryomorphaceae bacterium]|nr:hypothetical protein [Cryomorphaceae bacterium]
MKNHKYLIFFLKILIVGCASSQDRIINLRYNHGMDNDEIKELWVENVYSSDSFKYEDFTKFPNVEILMLTDIYGNFCDLCKLKKIKYLGIIDSEKKIISCVDSNCFPELFDFSMQLLMDSIFPEFLYNAPKLEYLGMGFINEMALPDINRLQENKNLSYLSIYINEVIEDSVFLSNYFENLMENITSINEIGFLHQNTNLDFHVDLKNFKNLQVLVLSDNIFDKNKFSSISALKELVYLEIFADFKFEYIEALKDFKKLRFVFLDIGSCGEYALYYKALKKVLPRKTIIGLSCDEE